MHLSDQILNKRDSIRHLIGARNDGPCARGAHSYHNTLHFALHPHTHALHLEKIDLLGLGRSRHRQTLGMASLLWFSAGPRSGTRPLLSSYGDKSPSVLPLTLLYVRARIGRSSPFHTNVYISSSFLRLGFSAAGGCYVGNDVHV